VHFLALEQATLGKTLHLRAAGEETPPQKVGGREGADIKDTNLIGYGMHHIL